MNPHQKQGAFFSDKANYPPSPNAEHIAHQGVMPPQPVKNSVVMHNEAKSAEKINFQGNVHGLSFSNPFGSQSQPYLSGGKQMARSYMKGPQVDLDSFKKEMLIKFHEVHRTLSEHGDMLKQLKQGNVSLNTTNTSFQYKADPFMGDMLRNLRKDMEFDHQTLQNRMMHEIENLRSEINDRFLRRQDLETQLVRFESKLSDQFQPKKDHQKDINELRDKIVQECRNLYEFLKKQLQANIHHIHEVNRVVFNKIQKDFMEIRQASQNNRTEIARVKTTVETDPRYSMFSSNKKCHDIRITKYKETIQKQGDRGNPLGEEITINEVVYYLDRDGYLLDKNSYYLVDQSGQQIQLDPKHITLLKLYNMLY